MEARMAREDAADEARWEAMQKAEDLKKAELQAGLAAYYNAMRQGEMEAQQKETSWLASIPFIGSQLDTAWQNSTIGTLLDAKIIEPIKTVFRPRNVVATLLTATVGLNTVQWINNVISSNDIFDAVQTRALLSFEELRVQHPPTLENLAYLSTHPYEWMAMGSDIFGTFTTIGASYVDVIWQQNPLVQTHTELMIFLEDRVCSGISNQALTNGCTAAFYLRESLVSNPVDTLLGVVNGFIADPAKATCTNGSRSCFTASIGQRHPAGWPGRRS
jgi:hypothetical protein